MIPPWCAEFVGTRYVEGGYQRNNEGYDCWGLIRAVYQYAYGIDVDDWDIEVAKGVWQPLGPHAQAKEGDMLVFTPDGVNHHVGLVVEPGRMIHAAESLGQILIEPYKSTLWKLQHKRTYRHTSL